MQRTKPILGEIYHIYNRGVEKRTIFIDDNDKQRSIYGLYGFNNLAPCSQLYRMLEVGLPTEDGRDCLVEILAYALMPNHYHLLVKQITDNGITEFIRKLGTGYTNAFNLKHNRIGPLFQGKYKYAHINNHRHLLYLSYYIHLNPLDLVDSGWRNKKIKNFDKIWNFLESYKWSSHLDCAGIKNTPHIINRDFLDKLFGGPNSYIKGLKEWIQEYDANELDQITLE